jgi:succinate dehydrogenase hydrophobic anchor subunit
MSYELHLHHESHAGDGDPFGREVYTEILSAISLLLSLVWMIPFNIMHYPADFLLSAGWFADFAVLLIWLHKIDCGSAFGWNGIQHLHNDCTRWRASEAFAFLSAIFWFASFVLVRRMSLLLRLE